MQIWRTIESTPVFAKAGAIIPLQPAMTAVEVNPSSLEIVVFPGADGQFTLIEDNGETTSALDAASTEMSLDWEKRTFCITPPTGNAEILPAHREWTVSFRGITDCEAVVSVNGTALEPAKTCYDPAALTLSVTLPELPIDSRVTVALVHDADIAQSPILDDCFAILHDAQIRYSTKEKALQILKDCAASNDYSSALNSLLTLENDETGHRAIFHNSQSVFAALSEVIER
jgi:hypothetical protein